MPNVQDFDKKNFTAKYGQTYSWYVPFYNFGLFGLFHLLLKLSGIGCLLRDRALVANVVSANQKRRRRRRRRKSFSIHWFAQLEELGSERATTNPTPKKEKFGLFSHSLLAYTKFK